MLENVALRAQKDAGKCIIEGSEGCHLDKVKTLRSRLKKGLRPRKQSATAAVLEEEEECIRFKGLAISSTSGINTEDSSSNTPLKTPVKTVMPSPEASGSETPLKTPIKTVMRSPEASGIFGWKSSNSIKTDGARHSATSKLHLKDQDFQDQDLKRSISCPRPPDVAASQMKLSASQTGTLNAPGGHIDISAVPITFYGKTYTWLHAKLGEDQVQLCFKKDPSEDDIDCVVTNYGVALEKLTYFVTATSFQPGHGLVNINTQLLGGVVKPGTEMPNAEPCSVELCSLSAVLANVTACGPQEFCQADNTCAILPVVCTVTGSTVIGFHGAVHSVQDRCAYSLMQPEGSASFNLTAAFRERRRTDVPLLDHLILSLPGVTMYLERGGRVRVDGEALVLNSTAQLMHGVELSKDHTGVTAKLPSSSMTLFFDGNSAHVAAPPEAVEGLCGNPSNSSWTTTLTAEKSSFSLPGCEIQSQDSVDSTINCTRSTDHCNLMRQPPFSACLNHTDPEPYISACTHTLCSYPSVDGVDCHFLEAYAKACSLEANVTLEDWRSTSGCSPPPLCQQPCSDHEFCGEEVGSTRCFCRALFASKYNATKSLGDPTVCRQDSASAVLAGCLLDDKGIDFSTLHLKDPSCKGHMDPKSHLVTFSFNSSAPCGTEVMRNNSQIVYENSIMSSNSSSGGVITRSDQIQIDFSCKYTQPEVGSESFRIKDSSVVQQLVSGEWNYTLTMSSFIDAGLLQPVGTDTEILLNQKVWLQLEAVGLDANMVAMVTDSCWETNQASPDSNLRYDLILNGCPNPADDTVQMQVNGQGTSSVFSFNMFEFSGASSEIYLHCKLELCPTQGQTCTPLIPDGGNEGLVAVKLSRHII
nr:alpha-tectorin-like [Pseudochaenichthys georgianus]